MLVDCAAFAKRALVTRHGGLRGARSPQALGFNISA